MPKLFVLLISYIFILFSLAGAEEIPVFDKEAFIVSGGVDKTLELGTVDCVAMALKNNSEINVKRISPLIEDANVLIQKARFEPSISFDFTMEDNTELSTSSSLLSMNPSKARTNIFNLGYDQKLVTGTELGINFYNTRLGSNSPVQSMNPYFDSEAEVTITQPLLKGFGILVNKADFLIAKNNKLRSRQDFAQEVINVVTNVKRSYYDLQYNREQYRIAETSVKRVQSLHEINKEKYAKGLASDVDLLESESEVARMEEALAAAEGAVKSAEDNLKLITNLVDSVEFWNAKIVLLDKISYEKYDPELVDAVLKAFGHRPDYESAKIDLYNKDISVAFNKNGVLPTLDLVGSYGLNGLGKNFQKDMGHVGGGKYDNWVIGVSVNIPLFNDEGKGNYQKSKLQKEQSLISFKRLEQEIILEVRDAVRNVDIKYRMLEASIKSKTSQEKNYTAQEERFKAGLVSTHDIIDYQERLARAELNYIKSVMDYKTSLIELARVEGMTLLNENITID